MNITFRKWLREIFESEDHFAWVDNLLGTLRKEIQRLNANRIPVNVRAYQGFIANLESTKHLQNDIKLQNLIARFYHQVNADAQNNKELRRLAGILEYWHSNAGYGDKVPVPEDSYAA